MKKLKTPSNVYEPCDEVEIGAELKTVKKLMALFSRIEAKILEV